MEWMTWLVAADRPRGLDPEIVRPGYLALAIVLILCLAVFLLGRSFFKHTKRAAQPWEGDPAPEQDEARQDSDAGR